ncbi:MAG: hypothetical protein MRY49_01970 [Candidatus Pacebacteria bacterium]|nr:hypothetical protein [Candidatus Paceibacterota bacterium]
MIVLRVILFLLLIISALYFPWWIDLVLLTLLFFIFPNYFEGIVFAAFYDVLFSSGFAIYATIYATACFLIFGYIRKNLL